MIGTDGVMELDTTRPPGHEIPSDAPMYMPEGPSARYNYEIGTVRYLAAHQRLAERRGALARRVGAPVPGGDRLGRGPRRAARSAAPTAAARSKK